MRAVPAGTGSGLASEALHVNVAVARDVGHQADRAVEPSVEEVEAADGGRGRGQDADTAQLAEGVRALPGLGQGCARAAEQEAAMARTVLLAASCDIDWYARWIACAVRRGATRSR